jgi:transglutaminase superfamily protein
MKLSKILALSASELSMLAEAAFAVVAIRVALWLFEFGRLNATLDRLAAIAAKASAATPPVERIAWAVKAVSARVPRASCLTQALALRLMLERRRVPATLRIGVARTPESSVEAHAWLECGGNIVIGEAEPGRYTALGLSGGE